MSTIGAVGQLLGLRGLTTPAITLQAGATRTVPAGNYLAVPGPYTFIQVKDPITGIWRNMNQVGNTPQFVESDGVNFRLANQTGCVVGAVVNVGGTSYTSGATGVTVSASTGGATLVPVVGGAIATTGTFAAVGTGYTFNPILDIAPPPAGGVPATGHITISSSTGSAIVIDNQGAGYTSAPVFTITNDPRDTTGTGMTITTWTIASTAAGAITACLVTNHGVPLATAPSLSTGNSGSGTSATLTAIMCLAVTSFTVASAGSVFSTLTNGGLQIGGFIAAGTTAWSNPAIEKGIFQPRAAIITLAGGTSLSSSGSVIVDAGLNQTTATMTVLSQNTIPSAAGALTCTMGGVTDSSFLIPV